MGKYILTKIWYFVINKWIFEIIVFINKCSNCHINTCGRSYSKNITSVYFMFLFLGFIKINIIIQNLINSKFILLQLLLQTIFKIWTVAYIPMIYESEFEIFDIICFKNIFSFLMIISVVLILRKKINSNSQQTSI